MKPATDYQVTFTWKRQKITLNARVIVIQELCKKRVGVAMGSEVARRIWKMILELEEIDRYLQIRREWIRDIPLRVNTVDLTEEAEDDAEPRYPVVKLLDYAAGYVLTAWLDGSETWEPFDVMLEDVPQLCDDLLERLTFDQQ